MEKIKVYIAGPYSSAPDENLDIAVNTANKLLNEGFYPFCPHLNHCLELEQHRSWQDWIEYDLEWLKVCDCLYRIPGESNGADIECAKAYEWGIPVFYDLKQLIEYYEKNNIHKRR